MSDAARAEAEFQHRLRVEAEEHARAADRERDEACAEIERLTALLERNGARWCICSRADRMNDRAHPECPHHGTPLNQQLDKARAAIDAAVAERLAAVWDDGVKAAGGYGHEDGWTHDLNPYDDNPYRAALSTAKEATKHE